MKLIIAISLRQGWLINHPECKVANSSHAVFFTTCSANEQLHIKGTEAFYKWMESTSSANIAPKTLNGENDIDTLCLQAIHDLMKDGASRKKLSPHDVRALKRARINDKRNETEVSILGNETISTVSPPSPESSNSTCTRTIEHPMHVISTAIPPEPLDTWPEKQDENDVKNKVRLLLDQIKKGYPSALIIIRNDKARDRNLVPKCQRQRLVVIKHETMLHVDGTRVHHELSRKFYWPNMITNQNDLQSWSTMSSS
jgi:hypothetical protein